jgi:membrane protease YdiL (CAAX protease family)
MSLKSEVSELKENKGVITKRAFAIGLFVIFATAYAQYVIAVGPIFSMFIVYGIPLFVTGFLWGPATMKKAFTHMRKALKFGIAFFGGFTLLGTLVAAAIFFLILGFDQAAVNLLNKPNPVLNISPEFAWIMVGVSLLVVGPVEEYLFRGFIYGGLLSLFKNHNWLSLAFLSSILFAAVHIYYALVYGIASLIAFIDVIAFGMAMAATYYLSSGNLFIPSIIHGVYDATAFIGVATSLDIGLLLRGFMILFGIIVAIALFTQNILGRWASRRQTIASSGTSNGSHLQSV